MNNTTFAQTLQQLGNSYLSSYAQSAERFAELLGGRLEKGSGKLDVENLPQRYADFVRNEGPRVVRQLADASLDYYSVVLNTGIESVSRYYEEVLRTSAPQMKQRSNAPKARSALLFRGIAGDTAQNAFLVTNNRPETIDIQLDMSELVSEDGTSRVQPEALFSPDRCRLGPRAEQVVQCSVRLGSEIPAGVDFRGRILVAGFPELAMDVRLHADRPAEPAPDTPYEQPAATGVRHKPSPKKAEAKSESKNATKPT